MKKLVAMIALSGVLSASALGITAQAAGRMTACCTSPQLVNFTETYRYDPAPDHHSVGMRTGKECKCGYREVYTDDWIGYEEHDYDIYDLENRRRYCECGDSFGW